MNKLDICLVAAVSENGVIGNGKDIPWKIPGEQKRFRELTEGHCVLMGRKTHESIGKLLQKRVNIIISRDLTTKFDSDKEHPDGVTTLGVLAPTIKLGIMAAEMFTDNKLFIIGGGQIYKQTIEFANEMVVTRVHTKVDGDVYYPPIDNTWDIVEEEHVKASIDYTIVKYKRNVKPTEYLEDTLDVII